MRERGGEAGVERGKREEEGKKRRKANDNGKNGVNE